mgnify:CR=1 FL=1
MVQICLQLSTNNGQNPICRLRSKKLLVLPLFESVRTYASPHANISIMCTRHAFYCFCVGQSLKVCIVILRIIKKFKTSCIWGIFILRKAAIPARANPLLLPSSFYTLILFFSLCFVYVGQREATGQVGNL